jgi:hypothetical protein
MSCRNAVIGKEDMVVILAEPGPDLFAQSPQIMGVVVKWLDKI